MTPAPTTDFAYAFAAPSTAYGSGSNRNQYSTYGGGFDGNTGSALQNGNADANGVGTQHQRTTSIFTGVSSGGVHQRTQSQAHATYADSDFDYGASAGTVVGAY